MATFFSFVSIILVIVGVVLLLELNPDRMTNDIIKFLDYENTLTVASKEARGSITSGRLSKEINAIRFSLETMGKGRQFAVVCSASLALLLAGMIISALINNWFLAPVLGVSLAFMPVIYVRSSLKHFDKVMNEELETALSIITTSYVRSEDIVASVRENIAYIRPPVKNLMISFVNQATIITSDIKGSIENLKSASNNYIFHEWCDALISCQDDRTQKTTLLPIIAKFTDIRQVNEDLETIVFGPRSEYLTMAILVIANFPLIYAIDKDWFRILTSTVAGKATTAFVILVLFVTAALMLKFTRQIEYKK